jgi:hypothetical protein
MDVSCKISFHWLNVTNKRFESAPSASTIFLNKISMLRSLIFESERPLTLAVPPRYQMEAIRGHKLALLFLAFKRSRRLTDWAMGPNSRRFKASFYALPFQPRANHMPDRQVLTIQSWRNGNTHAAINHILPAQRRCNVPNNDSFTLPMRDGPS